MVAGAPRTYDREKIANDILEWVKLDSSINLCEFCALNLIPANIILRWSREDDEFRTTYDIVRQFIGFRREQKLAEGKLHVKAYDLNAKTYDRFLKEEAREEKDYEATITMKIEEYKSCLKKQEQNELAKLMQPQFDAWFNMMQNQRKDLNIEDSSISTDCIS